VTTCAETLATADAHRRYRRQAAASSRKVISRSLPATTSTPEQRESAAKRGNCSSMQRKTSISFRAKRLGYLAGGTGTAVGMKVFGVDVGAFANYALQPNEQSTDWMSVGLSGAAGQS